MTTRPALDCASVTRTDDVMCCSSRGYCDPTGDSMHHRAVRTRDRQCSRRTAATAGVWQPDGGHAAACPYRSHVHCIHPVHRVHRPRTRAGVEACPYGRKGPRRGRTQRSAPAPEGATAGGEWAHGVPTQRSGRGMPRPYDNPSTPCPCRAGTRRPDVGAVRERPGDGSETRFMVTTAGVRHVDGGRVRDPPTGGKAAC
jgi:hypothetical protein